MVKTHVDMVTDFTMATAIELKRLASQHDFVIMEDRYAQCVVIATTIVILMLCHVIQEICRYWKHRSAPIHSLSLNRVGGACHMSCSSWSRIAGWTNGCGS